MSYVVEQHQIFQEKLSQLSRDMAAQDEQIMELATNLKTVEHSLHMNIQTELNHIQTIKNSAGIHLSRILPLAPFLLVFC
jgi:hypothetical protein